MPLYLAGLRLPIKTALACSLAVAAALAVPGTLVHAALGHIDWAVTAVFAVSLIPMSRSAPAPRCACAPSASNGSTAPPSSPSG